MSEVEMLYILNKICIASVDVIRSRTKKGRKKHFFGAFSNIGCDIDEFLHQRVYYVSKY